MPRTLALSPSSTTMHQPRLHQSRNSPVVLAHLVMFCHAGNSWSRSVFAAFDAEKDGGLSVRQFIRGMASMDVRAEDTDERCGEPIGPPSNTHARIHTKFTHACPFFLFR